VEHNADGVAVLLQAERGQDEAGDAVQSTLTLDGLQCAEQVQ